MSDLNNAQVFALVETDDALGDVHLRIARSDRLALKSDNEAVVGQITVGGQTFAVLAGEKSGAKPDDALLKLTNRELQIACLVREGACNKTIARRLRISPYTVASYLKRIFPKLDCNSRTELAARVAQVRQATALKLN
ncbi:MAG: LuxR C-terminal-related transcriptional regulator [Pseudomonadota bacterium]